jgi:hypothetical protein
MKGSRYREAGQKLPLALPKGIVLSPDELTAHVEALRSQGEVEREKQGHHGKQHMGGSSGYKEVEVVFFNEQKSSVYVFDGSSRDETYVVLEVRGCEKGPLLLPPEISDSGGRWSSPEDRYLHLATYLVTCMSRLNLGDWSDRITMELNGEILVRYQAAVREKDWHKLWEDLMKPFATQRTAYRGVYRTQKAPDLFFGVSAKITNNSRKSETPTEVLTDNSSERDNARVPPSSSSNEGIPLPTAADWVDYWHQQNIPTRRTFIEFASDLGQAALPPRSNSSPDLSSTGISPDGRLFSL